MSHTSTDEVHSDRAYAMPGTKGPPLACGPPPPQMGPAPQRLFGQSGTTSEASNITTTWWHSADPPNRSFPPLPPPLPGRDRPEGTHATSNPGTTSNGAPLTDALQPWHHRPPPIIPPSFLEPATRPSRQNTLTTAEVRRRSVRNQQRADERRAQGRTTIPEWECTACAKTNWMQAAACRACGLQRSTTAKVIEPRSNPHTHRADGRHHQTIEQATRAL